MLKENRFYTLIIRPATSNCIYKVILHYRHLYAVAIGGLVGFSLLAFTSVWVLKQTSLLLNYQRIRSENQLLKQRQSILLQRIQARLASIEETSNQVRQMAEEMGLDVNEELDAEEQNPTPGVGGPNALDLLTNKLDITSSHLKLLKENLQAEKTRLAMTPSGWPIVGRLNSRFGMRRDPFGQGYQFHSGVDIGGRHGTPVRATADGLVVFAGYQGGYGALVVLDHGRDIQTYYGHLSQINVSVGDHIQRHDQIGRVGSTGRATAPHVHYEIRMEDRPINPRTFSPARPVQVGASTQD